MAISRLAFCRLGGAGDAVVNSDLTAIIAGAAIVGGFSLIWFFVRGYFNNLSTVTKENTKAYHQIGKMIVKLETRFDDQAKDLARLEGTTSQMSRDLRGAVESIYQAKMELKALWRFADGAVEARRASDRQ